MRYIFILLTLVLVSCGQKKGCLNQLSSNYDPEALVDCCCEFSVDRIIEDLAGTHTMKELCSGSSKEYELTISKDSTRENSIVVTNFNNQGYDIAATWNVSEFQFLKEWKVGECDVTITGSLHRNNGKVHMIYAAIPPNSCANFSPTTCESRGL